MLLVVVFKKKCSNKNNNNNNNYNILIIIELAAFYYTTSLHHHHSKLIGAPILRTWYSIGVEHPAIPIEPLVLLNQHVCFVERSNIRVLC